ncbi:DUF554 domain-containing protein [bacterium]|nr:DUF554 domain-containing protein [bacterium]
MIGTVINTITVIAGSSVGLLLGNKFSERLQKIAIQSVGLFTLTVGIKMAFGAKDINESIVVLISLAIGGIIGELLDIESFLERLGDTLKKKASSNVSTFTQGFMAASLLFCVGPMAITGAIEDGIKGTYNILLTKSIMDGISSVVLSASLGIGVIFSSLVVLGYQGVLTILASMAGSILPESSVNCITVVGGLMIIGIGINLLGIGKIKVGNLLPGLLIGGLLGALL